MPSPADLETTYPDDFASSVAGDIGSELFPSSESTLPEEIVAPAAAAPAPEAAPKPEAAPGTTPPAGEITPGVNSVLKPLPKSWKKDMAPLWEKADPALHEYVYAREADVMRGFQMYAAGHQQWDTLVKPFAPIFQQHPDVNPVQIMQGLMNTHLQLLNPNMPLEQKRQMAVDIFREYGIDVSGAPASPDAAYSALEARLAKAEAAAFAVQRESQQRAEQAYREGVSQQQKTVEAFAKNPANKYFDAVGNDILRLIQSGAATDLQSAYDIAIYANPTVRAKVLAEQQATAPAGKPRNPASGQFVNVVADEAPPPRQRKGSISDTIDAVVNAHYGNSKH